MLSSPWIKFSQYLTPFKYRSTSGVNSLCFSYLSRSTFVFFLYLEWSSLDAKRRPYFCLSGLSLALAESWHPSLFVEWGSLETQIFYNDAHTYRVVKSSLRVIRIVIVKWNMNSRGDWGNLNVENMMTIAPEKSSGGTLTWQHHVVLASERGLDEGLSENTITSKDIPTTSRVLGYDISVQRSFLEFTRMLVCNRFRS